MTGYTSVSAASLQDATGTLINNATIRFAPVDNKGNPLSFRAGGTAAGQAISQPVSTQVTNGAFSIQLADTALTTPVNVCYAVTVIDNVSGRSLLGPGYGQFQPSGVSYNFDTFVPNSAAQAVVQTGPQGVPGQGFTFRGAWTANTGYAVNDVFTSGGSSYVVTAAFTSGSVISLTNTSLFATGGGLQLSDVQNYVSSVVAGGGSSTQYTNGSTGVTPLSSTVSSVVVVIPDVFQHAGALSSVSTTMWTAPVGGSLTFLILNAVGTPGSNGGQWTIADKFVVVPAATGTPTIQTFTAGVDFAARNITAGQYLGYYTNDPATLPAYVSSNNTGDGHYALTNVAAASVAVGSTLNIPQVSTSQHIELEGVVTYTVVGNPLATQSAVAASIAAATTPINSSIAALQIPQFHANRTLVLSATFPGTSLPSGWVASAGTWTVNNGLLTPTDVIGYNSYISLQQYFLSSQRVMRTTFAILSAGSVLGFGSTQAAANNTTTMLNSLVVVDSSANTIAIQYSGPSGTNNGVNASAPLGFTMATGQNYVLSVIMNERQITASLTDPLTGITGSVNSTGSNAASDNGYEVAGTFQDYPAFFGIAGQSKITNFSILENVVRPRVFFLGDSLTWGFNLPTAQRFASLVTAQIANNSTIVSGRIGGKSLGGYLSMATEVVPTQPGILVVLLGSNDYNVNVPLATYQANMTAIITQANAAGIRVVLCTLPTAGSMNSLRTSYNQWILSLTNIAAVVRMDLATSLNNDGVTFNPALFGSDQLHPNAAGGLAMAARFAVDAPFVFD